MPNGISKEEFEAIKAQLEGLMESYAADIDQFDDQLKSSRQVLERTISALAKRAGDLEAASRSLMKIARATDHRISRLEDRLRATNATNKKILSAIKALTAVIESHE